MNKTLPESEESYPTGSKSTGSTVLVLDSPVLLPSSLVHHRWVSLVLLLFLFSPSLSSLPVLLFSAHYPFPLCPVCLVVLVVWDLPYCHSLSTAVDVRVSHPRLDRFDFVRRPAATGQADPDNSPPPTNTFLLFSFYYSLGL
ncbi:hypothetical protein BDW62DRAFT_33966 [Aspergillus aurantiobrunneus]